MLKTLAVHAFIYRSVLPRLFTLAILQVVGPVSFVLRAIYIEVGPEAVGFVFMPFAIEDVPIDMVKHATSMSLVILPLTLVARSIRPGLLTEAMAQVTHPLSVVDSSILKSVLALILHTLAHHLGCLLLILLILLSI